MRTRAAVGLALVVASLGLLAPVTSTSKSTNATATSRAESTSATASSRSPLRGPRKAARRALRHDTAVAPAAVSTLDNDVPSHGNTVPAMAATPATPSRVAQLHTAVMQQAVRRDWITVDDDGSACPPQRLKILFAAPTDLSSYDRGAYFEPLGPEPDDSSIEVNGVLICDGYSFMYRGFEAYYRADRDQWDVYPFPVIE